MTFRSYRNMVFVIGFIRLLWRDDKVSFFSLSKTRAVFNIIHVSMQTSSSGPLLAKQIAAPLRHLARFLSGVDFSLLNLSVHHCLVINLITEK